MMLKKIIVIWILFILIGLCMIYSNYNTYIIPENKDSRCKSELYAILTAIGAYYDDFGEFPVASENGTTFRILEGSNTRKENYIFNTNNKNIKGEFLDPWNNPYIISFDRNKIQVKSTGLNLNNKDDDITESFIVKTE